MKNRYRVVEISKTEFIVQIFLGEDWAFHSRHDSEDAAISEARRLANPIKVVWDSLQETEADRILKSIEKWKNKNIPLWIKEGLKDTHERTY